MDRDTEIRGLMMHALAIRSPRTTPGSREPLKRDCARGFAFAALQPRRGIEVVCWA